MQFEWDLAKARANFAKHHVSFEEATTVFGDPLSITFADPDHSTDEDRYVIIGTTPVGRLLIVAHTDRRDRIRIISAREAMPRERRAYERGN